MIKTASHSLRTLVIVAAALLAACADDEPLAMDRTAAQPQFSAQSAEENRALAELRRATARYHDLDVAIAEGFVFLHGCENRPDEGPVGTVYIHLGRLTDGKIDPASPDGLIYEPAKQLNQRPKLVGVEFAVPYALWTGPTPPSFFGNTFQREDEFGVFGLHAWVWQNNPEGMFAESNPRVSCGEE